MWTKSLPNGRLFPFTVKIGILSTIFSLKISTHFLAFLVPPVYNIAKLTGQDLPIIRLVKPQSPVGSPLSGTVNTLGG